LKIEKFWRHKKDQNYPIFYLFLNFDLAKGEDSAPLAPPLVAPLGSRIWFTHTSKIMLA